MLRNRIAEFELLWRALECPLATQQKTELTTNRLLEETMTQKIRYLVLGESEKTGSLRWCHSSLRVRDNYLRK